MNKNNVRIFCDGSGSAKGTPGGWAYIVVDELDEIFDEISGGCEDTTSNRMELKAFIESLEFLKRNPDIKNATIISDSRYIVDGVNDWLENWKILNFVHTKNDDLWRYVNKLLYKDKIKVKVRWMRGHQKKEIFNNLVDQMAGLERRAIVNALKKKV